MTNQITEHGPYNFTSECLPGLSKLIEECGEVVQVAAKLIATNGETKHWAEDDLYVRLTEELGDLMAATSFFLALNPQFSASGVLQRSIDKIDKFSRWHNGE